MNITTNQILALRTEAAAAGDLEMVDTCDRALTGDEDARCDCEEVIEDARDRIGEDRHQGYPVFS